MELKNQILKALGLNKDEEINLEFQAKLIDGTIIVSSADELAAGVDIAILAEDGTTMPLPIGKYETEDGQGFSVEEEGVIDTLIPDISTKVLREVVLVVSVFAVETT